LSLLKAVRDAQWNLRASEARFEEVATSSASGILITELDGRMSRVNGAIGDILGYTPAELTQLTVFDLVHPQYAPALREDYQNLLAGRKERIKQRLPLALDFCGAVLVISQPFRLSFVTSGERREHTPDFLAVLPDGSTWVFDVRPGAPVGA
jgi:PAS domain-containing protein